MFASIMDGMKAQRERSTTNRREAAKLFNEHLKNQSDLGIEVTEQSLADAWDSNSGGVMRKHAPTQQRLQSIVTAQNKSLAEKQAATDFAATEQQRRVDAFVLEDLKKGLNENSMLGDGARSVEDLNTSFTEMFENNPLMIESYIRQSGVGGNRLGEMQKGFYAEAQAPQMELVLQHIAAGSYDASTLKKVYTNVDPAFIDNAVDQAKKDQAQQDKEFEQADIIFAEGRDVFAEGRITFKNQQVTFQRKEKEAILAAAQKVVQDTYQNKFNNLTLVEKNAAIEKAEKDIIRLVIEQNQDDLKFAQDQYTFHADVTQAILTAADLVTTRAATNAESAYNFGQTKVEDSQALKVFNQDQAKQPAIDLQSAKKDIDDNYTTATIETVTADLSRWGLTDPAIITQTWNQVRKKQEVFDLTGMTANNNSVKEKLITATSKNQKRVADFKVMTNSSLLANFKSVPADYHPEINAVAQRHIIGSDTVMPMRDWITKQVESGAWDDTNAVQRQSALYTWLESTGTPTYSSQMAQLQANSKSLAGVTQYTPARFKEVYISAFQTDAEYAIAQMENASQSNNVAGYNSAKASLAVLLTETQQDLLARKNNPQKAFGMRASQEEMSAATTDLGQLLKTIIDASEGIEVPVEKDEVDKGLRYEPVLFTPDFGSSSRIRSVDDALSYLANRTGGRAFSASGLSALQDDYTNLISSHEANKEELKKLENTNNVTEKLRLDKLLVENLNKLHEIHFEVKQIIRKVIADSERVGFI